MLSRADNTETGTPIRTDLRAIFVSLELSRTTWLVTSLSPGAREKMSKRSVPAGDIGNLLDRLRSLQERVQAQRKQLPPLVVIQEAGLEGFWIHRVLTENGTESHVVDPASIATSRRRRRAKTDKLDGDTLVRTLLAYKRGEPRVCAMVRAPTPEEEDRRRLSRERRVLLKSVSSIAIGSKDCCSVRASLVMSRCVGTAASDWSDCKPAMDGRCLPISRLRLIANSTVWRW